MTFKIWLEIILNKSPSNNPSPQMNSLQHGKNQPHCAPQWKNKSIVKENDAPVTVHVSYQLFLSRAREGDFLSSGQVEESLLSSRAPYCMLNPLLPHEWVIPVIYFHLRTFWVSTSQLLTYTSTSGQSDWRQVRRSFKSSLQCAREKIKIPARADLKTHCTQLSNFNSNISEPRPNTKWTIK